MSQNTISDLRNESNVAVIIVTYNPNVEYVKKQLDVLDNTGIVVIVDNGSNAITYRSLEATTDQYLNAKIHSLEVNLGIATAQNIGVDIAIRCNAQIDFFWFLDHDSLPGDRCLTNLLVEYGHIAKLHPKVGAIGPFLVDPRSGNTYGFHKFSNYSIYKITKKPEQQNYIECDQLNSSGTLIPVESWHRIGEFNGSFFIDHVETEWCFRARDRGYLLFGVFTARLFHEMGDRNINYWFFGRKTMPDRAPIRHYFIFRNSIALQKLPFVPKRWKYMNIIKLTFTLTFFFWFHLDRFSHIKFMFSGIADGIRNKMGKSNHWNND